VAPWEKRCLEKPVTIRLSYSKQELNCLGSLQELVVGFDLSSYRIHQDELEVESSILGRLGYKIKGPYRNNKLLRNMKKITTCLRRFFSIKLPEMYYELQQLFPRPDDPSSQLLLPSQQLFHYTLVRSMSAVALLSRAFLYCQDAMQYILQLMSMKHRVPTFLLTSANIARIWSLSRALVMLISKFYNQLRPWLEKLKSASNQILPLDEPPLPLDLLEWLGEDGNPYLSQGIESNVDTGPAIEVTTDREKDTSRSRYQPTTDDDEIQKSQKKKKRKRKKSQGNQSALARSQRNLESIKQLNNLKEFKMFMSREESSRKQGASVTSHMTKAQWKAFRKWLTKRLTSARNREAVNIQQEVAAWVTQPQVHAELYVKKRGKSCGGER